MSTTFLCRLEEKARRFKHSAHLEGATHVAEVTVGFHIGALLQVFLDLEQEQPSLK